jgi:SAM-dependent methyltransferase
MTANPSETAWILKQREIFEGKECIHVFYNHMFSLLIDEVSNEQKSGKIVEIGSGAGFSSNFINDFKYVKTDAIETGFQDEIVDAQSLPYDNQSIDIIFGIDVFHHISKPFQFLEEVSRVLRKDGKLILIEPAITLMSWPIYKFIHPEPMKWCVKLSPDSEFSGPDVMDANNALPSLIFRNNSFGDLSHFNLELKYKTKLFGFLSMLATGGVNNPKSIPLLSRYVTQLFMWETKRSKKFASAFFLRTLVVVEKNV